jgi:hypothetical protein
MDYMDEDIFPQFSRDSFPKKPPYLFQAAELQASQGFVLKTNSIPLSADDLHILYLR